MNESNLINESSHIIVEIKKGVLRLGINRPEKKNALTKKMYHTLCQSLLDAKNDTRIKSVLIYGTIDAFSAGNDLKDFDNREPGQKSGAELLLNVLHEFEKPLVASVSGFAIGIGVTLLMHCDLVYAAPDTRFRLPFVNLGVLPEGASTILLPLNAGYRQAAELLMLGAFFDTERAIEVGVVTRSIQKDQLLETASNAAQELAQKPVESILLTKRLMKQGLREEISDRITLECKYFEKLLLSEESIAARQKIKN